MYKNKPSKRIALPHHVSESVQTVIKKYSKSPGFKVCKLQEQWEMIVGQDIANLIQPVKWLNTVVTVKSDSPSAKFTLSYRLPIIIEKINMCFGTNAVTTIYYERN